VAKRLLALRHLQELVEHAEDGGLDVGRLAGNGGGYAGELLRGAAIDAEKQLAEGDAEGVGEGEHGFEGETLLAAFGHTHEGAADADFLRELLPRPAALFA